MNFKKNIAVYSVITTLAIVAVVGWSVALHRGNAANAQSDSQNEKVDSATLDSLYEAAFHRPADAEGKAFNLGRNLKDVLRDFNMSPEMKYYGALFKAVKSYEEDQRAPGTLTTDEKQAHLDLINSALATLLAWVDTLPDRDVCKATVGAEEARAAIQSAFDGMSPAAKLAAQKGVFNVLQNLGRPDAIQIHDKCVRLSVSPTPSMTPLPSATTHQ